MMLRFILVLSLIVNLALGTFWFLKRPRSPMPGGAIVQTNFTPGNSNPAFLPVPVAAPAPAVAVAAPFPWRLIESDDYEQYVANLRAAGCPERLIRDIIVADIDDVYQQKSPAPSAYVPPWNSADRRRAAARTRAAQLHVLKNEKRARVRELIGYEWDNHADEVWTHDPASSLMLGFVSDDKAARVLTLHRKYEEAAEIIRADAHDIVIEPDRARLRSAYDSFLGELNLVLTPVELEEYTLRLQGSQFFPAHDVHFDGVAVSGGELREIARLSKSIQDANREAFDGRPVSEAEDSRRLAEFERQLKTLLNPARFADYQRAQDGNFRDTLAFTQQEKLPGTMAVNLYNARRVLDDESDALKQDTSLSAGQRAAARALLAAETKQKLGALLGARYDSYLAGPGQWIGNETPDTETPTSETTP